MLAATRSASVRQRLSMQRPVVNAFAAQRRAVFSEMNTHLVRATCLQTALHEGVVSQVLDNAHVRHGALAFTGITCAAAAAVAAVIDQVRFDAFVFCLATHQGKIATLNGMRAELLAERTLRLGPGLNIAGPFTGTPG